MFIQSLPWLEQVVQVLDMALRHYTINFAAKFDTIAITLTMLEQSTGYSQAIDQCTETQVQLFLPSPTYQR